MTAWWGSAQGGLELLAKAWWHPALDLTTLPELLGWEAALYKPCRWGPGCGPVASHHTLVFGWSDGLQHIYSTPSYMGRARITVAQQALALLPASTEKTQNPTARSSHCFRQGQDLPILSSGLDRGEPR